MPRSWILGHPDYLIDEWSAEPSLTFKESMRFVLSGRGRLDHSPLIPGQSLIFWTRMDMQILRALAFVNPELLASLQICPYAEDESMTEYFAVEIRIIAEGKFAELFSQRFDNHYFFIRNPAFPWNDPVTKMDPRQDLDEVFHVANTEELRLVRAAGPTRVSASRSAQPPHAYVPKISVPQLRKRSTNLTQTGPTSESAVLYHAEPGTGVELDHNEQINPVAYEQSYEPPNYEAVDAGPHLGFAATSPHEGSEFSNEDEEAVNANAYYRHLLEISSRPPPAFESIGSDANFMQAFDMLKNRYPGGDILLSILRTFQFTNTEAFLNHGKMFDWHTAVGLNPFHTLWNNDTTSEQYGEPPEQSLSQEPPLPPIPYNRYRPAETYFERGLVERHLARTWEFTAEDAAMIGLPTDETNLSPDSDSHLPRIPEELWLTGSPRVAPDYPPSVAALWDPPHESEPSIGIFGSEQPEVDLHPEGNQSELWRGDTETPTTSTFTFGRAVEPTAAMDDGLAYFIYPPAISLPVEDPEKYGSPPIIEIDQGRYRSYRELAKMNRILHDLPPEEDKRTYLCVFCKRNDEPPSVYQSHPIRINGVVVCPHLRLHVCQLCKATGDEAHTIKYCPKNKRGFFATKARCKGPDGAITAAETSSDDLGNISPESNSGSSQADVGSGVKSPGTTTVNQNSGWKTTVAWGNRKMADRLIAPPRHRRRRGRRSAQIVRNARA